MRFTPCLAAALLAAASLPAAAGTKSAPYAGVYAFNSCKYAGKDSLTLHPGGRYSFGWAAGTWRRDGKVIVIDWAIRGRKHDSTRFWRVRATLVTIATFYIAGYVAVFWGTLLATGIVGTLHQDVRLSRRRPDYAVFMAETPYFPLPTPRALRSIDRVGWLGLIVGVVVGLAVRRYHVELVSLFL